MVIFMRMQAAWWNTAGSYWSTQDVKIQACDAEAGTVTVETLNFGRIRLFQVSRDGTDLFVFFRFATARTYGEMGERIYHIFLTRLPYFRYHSTIRQTLE